MSKCSVQLGIHFFLLRFGKPSKQVSSCLGWMVIRHDLLGSFSEMSSLHLGPCLPRSSWDAGPQNHPLGLTQCGLGTQAKRSVPVSPRDGSPPLGRANSGIFRVRPVSMLTYRRPLIPEPAPRSSHVLTTCPRVGSCAI